MRILHVISSLDPDRGGPTTVAARLAAAQALLGDEVTLLSYASPGREAAINAALSRIPNMATCRLERLPLRGRFEGLTAAGAREYLRNSLIPMGCDVMHLHGVWDPILRAAAEEARRHVIPYVFLPHGMLDPWSLRQRSWKKRLALALGYRALLHDAAFLHVLNADEARLIEPLQLGCRIEVIPNGIFVEEVEPLPVKGRFRAAHPQLGQRPFVLFLGRLHYKKGLDYLIDAFASFARERPDWLLVVAGPDDGALMDLKSRVSAAELTERVLLPGPLYGDKYEALADASCLCLPSRQEGFSLSITEALACAVPVVISTACHFPEVAEVGAGEVVDLDASAISAALLRVTAEEAARQRMGCRGREMILARFTWPMIAERMIAAYRRSQIRTSGSRQLPAPERRALPSTSSGA